MLGTEEYETYNQCVCRVLLLFPRIQENLKHDELLTMTEDEFWGVVTHGRTGQFNQRNHPRPRVCPCSTCQLHGRGDLVVGKSKTTYSGWMCASSFSFLSGSKSYGKDFSWKRSISGGAIKDKMKTLMWELGGWNKHVLYGRLWGREVDSKNTRQRCRWDQRCQRHMQLKLH